ncbi:MAG: TadE/TadG family type IV pilus assembly protein [Hyphomicrobiaceae bacterium]
MSTEMEVSKAAGASPAARVMRRWRTDDRGVTALEFGIVAAPFFMLLFGIIGIGLYFFTTFTIENAVEQASRLLRTGQAQQAAMTDAQFKAKICELVPGHIDCAGKLKVNVKSFDDSEDITADALPKCLDGGGNLAAATQYTPGGASKVVLVWVCFEWEFAKSLPFLNFSDMGNGSRLIQATTTFRTEPYN